jgi:hypothetical protein
MEKELLALLFTNVMGYAVFGKFESHSPWWRSVLKWSAMVGIIWTLSTYFGHTVALLVLLAMMSLAIFIHFYWCKKNGIHPIAATPRKKYFELRGWTWEE